MAISIKDVVKTFKGMDDRKRYFALDQILEEDTTDPGELAWRARLCTALERASVYPKQSYDKVEEVHEGV